MSFFITLEGPDGCGKTTQSEQLIKHLRESEHKIIDTREPGGTTIGDQIRFVLMKLDNTAMNPRTEFLLFSASRAQLVDEVIRPGLAEGAIVVSDRFYDSSLAYQGYGHGLDLETLKTVTEFATGGLVPDLSLLLDLPAASGLERRKDDGRWNRLDDYDKEFHRRVRKGYRALAEADPQRWRIVDATQSPDKVQLAIREIVRESLAKAVADA